MKNSIYKAATALAVIIILAGCAGTTYVATGPAPDPGPVTYQSFYDNLSPYGTWIDYPGYGHVWNPRAEAGFRPYATNGQWRYSGEGWVWQSNYNWGWAPFHYGRWLYDDNYGWLWVPGYDWSPAWVTWGSVNNYYAWAPLMPEVNVGVRYSDWRPHSAYWNMVPREHLGDRNVSNVIVRNVNISNTNVTNNNTINIYNKSTNVTNNNITKNITIINNYNTSRTNNYYAKGPDVKEVEKYTRQPIQPVSFKEVHQIAKPNTNGNVMEVYRPVVQNPHQQNGPTAATAPTNNISRPISNDGSNSNATPNSFNTPNNTHPYNAPANNSMQPIIHENTPARGEVQVNGPATPIHENHAPANALKPNNNANPGTYTPPAESVQHGAPPALPQPQANSNQHPQVFQNAQPRIFRKADAGQIRPIREESQQPTMQQPRQQQRQQQRNIQQLPMQRSPANFSRGGNGNGNRRQERN